MSAINGEMLGADIGRRETRALQRAVALLGLVLYKEGDGPGGLNTLTAHHPGSDTIFIGFMNESGKFDDIDTLMTDVMGEVIPAH
jgi:hypothetical protein